MKRLLALATILCAAAWAAESEAQSKEDLLSGTPLDPQVVYNALQTPAISTAIVQCGAGKLSAGTATLNVSVAPSGKATLTGTDPPLPAEVSGCIGGVMGSLSLPPSGLGVEVDFLFTFPATAPPTYQPPPKPQYPPEYYSGHRMRRAGIGLVIPGAIFFGLGALVAVASLANDSTNDRRAMLYTGGGLMVVGAIFLVPGIILVSIGKKRAAAAMMQAGVPMPGLALDTQIPSARLTLTWTF